MSIAARIAAEHQLVQHGGLYEDEPDACGCGWSQRTYGHTFHVVAVTEAAVRAQVAADIEVKRAEAALAATAYREAGDESAAWEAAMSAHAYGYAARIAEGGHQ